MDTIHEDDEEDDTKSMELGSKNNKDYSREVIQQYIKEQRKLQENSKIFSMKAMKPPKWICTVKNCKWGGRDMQAMMDHLKKQHPNEDGSQFKVEYKSISNLKYGQARKSSLKSIKRNMKVKKEVEQLEQQIKDL